MSYLSRMISVVRRAPRGIGQSLGINELRPLVAKMVVMTERAGTLLSLESSRCHSNFILLAYSANDKARVGLAGVDLGGVALANGLTCYVPRHQRP